MAYPEKNAGYKNRPAWLDRAVAGEKHADGGPVADRGRSGRADPALLAQVAKEFEPAAAQEAREDAAERVSRSGQRLRVHNEPMLKAGLDPET